MTDLPRLFEPLRLGSVRLPNRIMVSPMCQYSARAGCATDWHTIHLGALATSGAGLLCLEATAVSMEGRITPGCLGLYSDANEDALRRLLHMLRGVTATPLGIQLSHAGRKGSCHVPWAGGRPLSNAEGAWHTAAPSTIPQMSDAPLPSAMNAANLRQVVADFREAARRARRLGFDVIEVHMAHGYLLHQFLSPLANRREDCYGGSLENRLRLPLEVFEVVAEAAGHEIAVGARISASDWAPGGFEIAEAVLLAQALERRGCKFVDVTSGGLSAAQKVTPVPGYQTGFAAVVRRAVRMPVVTVGLISEPSQAEEIVRRGDADLVAMARAFLREPRWPWRAAAELGGLVAVAPQLSRAIPPGARPVFAVSA
ncbi:MAG: NADH:flavin oxidoreductase/NADH oxidase [Lautropia sp.]